MKQILITNKYDNTEIYFELEALRFHLRNKYGHISGCFLFRIDPYGQGILFDEGVGNKDIIPSIDTSDYNSKLIIIGVDEIV